jgi:hypothetical protein
MADDDTNGEATTPGRCEVLDPSIQPATGVDFELPISGLPLSEIKRQYPDDYAILLEKLYDLDDGIIRKLVAKDWSNAGVVFEHVYPLGDFIDRNRLLEKLDSIGNAFGHRALFGYTFDPKEVHIFHDCAYANKSCRCKFKGELAGIKAKIGAKRNRCADFDAEWLTFGLYYLLRKRGSQKIWLGGTCEGPPDSCKYEIDKFIIKCKIV